MIMIKKKPSTFISYLGMNNIPANIRLDEDVLKTSKDIFKTFSRSTIRLNCLPMSRICLGHTSEKLMVSVENV